MHIVPCISYHAFRSFIERLIAALPNASFRRGPTRQRALRIARLITVEGF